MSDLRKAAEIALEALEWNYGTDLENIENCMAWLEKMNATIPALRQALAQPEQEPLVWMNKYGHVASFQNEEYKDPLYTAPPKREWVGLTDEDRSDLLTQHHGWNEFGIAIEAKLKEKNA